MLSLKATREDIFGPHFVALELDVPASGRYWILVDAVIGPAQGKLQLFRNEDPLGAAIDLYAPSRAKSGLVELGEADLEEGENVVFFRSAGRNEQSEGIRIDLVSVVLEPR